MNEIKMSKFVSLQDIIKRRCNDCLLVKKIGIKPPDCDVLKILKFVEIAREVDTAININCAEIYAAIL